MTRLLDLYKNNITKDLKSKLNVVNIHEVPKIQKIVLNIKVNFKNVKKMNQK